MLEQFWGAALPANRSSIQEVAQGSQFSMVVKWLVPHSLC